MLEARTVIRRFQVYVSTKIAAKRKQAGFITKLEYAVKIELTTRFLRELQLVMTDQEGGSDTTVGGLHFDETRLAIVLERKNVIAGTIALGISDPVQALE